MVTTAWVTVYALAISAIALMGAAILHLAHETRDIPKRQRVKAITVYSVQLREQ